jgi:hypothetical protein
MQDVFGNRRPPFPTKLVWGAKASRALSRIFLIPQPAPRPRPRDRAPPRRPRPRSPRYRSRSRCRPCARTPARRRAAAPRSRGPAQDQRADALRARRACAPRRSRPARPTTRRNTGSCRSPAPHRRARGPAAGPGPRRSRNWPPATPSAPAPPPRPARSIDRQVGLGPGGDAVMLDRRRVQAAPGQRQRRRLGRARGEDDLARAGADRLGCLRPRPLDDRPRGPALGMHRGRIADRVHRRDHRRARLRAQRRARVPVEIGARPPHSSTTSTKAGTAGQGASWLRTTSQSRVWCRKT